MGRRRRSRRSPMSSGFLGGIRKNLKKGIGIAAVAVGASLALAPAISSVYATTGNGTSITQASLSGIPINLAGAYGVNPSTGALDFGLFINKLVFPILGGVIALKGLRYIAKSV